MVRINHLLNSSVTIWRLSSVPDGAGGEVTALAQVGESAAMISQPTATERVLAAQGQSRHTHTVHLPPVADVRRNDELRCGAQVFRVQSVFQPSRPIYVRADVELIQRG
jgi:head-tail adaptor